MNDHDEIDKNAARLYALEAELKAAKTDKDMDAVVHSYLRRPIPPETKPVITNEGSRVVGMKHDNCKPMAGMVLGEFKRALMSVAEVGTFGANKYGKRNWLYVSNSHERYYDALWRHLLATEERDQETGVLHLAQVAWNALAVLELQLRAEEEAKSDTPT